MFLVIGLTVIATLAVVAAVLLVQNALLAKRNSSLSGGYSKYALSGTQKRYYEGVIADRDEVIRKLIGHSKRQWSKHARSYIVENIGLTLEINEA